MLWDGSPSTIARTMWNLVPSYDWNPGEFQSLFERLYNNNCDLETLWQLGGAVNDYLRRNPREFTVPPELPRRLLASPKVDARIVGLKLLNRADVNVSEIGHAIVEALRASAEYGEYSGLYETGNFVARCRESRIGLLGTLARDLVAALREYVANKDDNDQRIANHLIKELEEISV